MKATKRILPDLKAEGCFILFFYHQTLGWKGQAPHFIIREEIEDMLGRHIYDRLSEA